MRSGDDFRFTSSSSTSSLRFSGGLHPKALHYRHLLDYSCAMLLPLVSRSHILFIKPVLIKKLLIFSCLAWLHHLAVYILYLLLPINFLIIPSLFQRSQISRIYRETHAFQPVHTLSRHTLYFSRCEGITCPAIYTINRRGNTEESSLPSS